MDRRQIISMIGGAIAAASTGRSASLGAAAKIPRIGIIDETQKEMLEGRIFVMPLIGGRKRTMERLFEIT